MVGWGIACKTVHCIKPHCMRRISMYRVWSWYHRDGCLHANDATRLPKVCAVEHLTRSRIVRFCQKSNSGHPSSHSRNTPSIDTMSQQQVYKVLDFWFGKPGEPDYLRQKSFWYGSPEDDKLVEENLGELHEMARSGQLDNWIDSVDGSIALIILLDQVPRNIFRDTPRAYDCDDKALEVAKKVVEKGWDRDQPSIIRRYIYSPFNHSENLEDQKRSVDLFTDLGDSHHLYWAKNFYEIIKTHGRFPHRDAILRRNNPLLKS